MRLANDTPLTRLHKGQQAGDDIRSAKIGSDFFTGLFHIQVRAVKKAVGLAKRARVFGHETSPLESDLIDATDFGRVAISDHIGGDILNNFRATTHDGMLAQAAKLMDSGKAADNDMILDSDMTCDCAVVGKNNMVTNDAVVRYVRVGEKISVIANDRLGSRQGATVDGAKFSK